MKSIQAWATCALVLFAAAGCGGGSTSSGNSPGTLSAESANLIYCAARSCITPLMAGDLGFFTKRNLTMTFTQASDLITPLASGSADISMPGPTSIPNAISKGIQVKMLLTTDALGGGAIVVDPTVAAKLQIQAGKFPDAILALKGKKISITARGSGTDYETRYLIVQAGLNPDKDFTIVATGGLAAGVAALKTHQVDAAFTGSPYLETLQQQGYVIAINMTEGQGPDVVAGLPADVAITTAAFANAHPAAASRFVAGMLEFDKYAKDSKNYDTIKGLVSKYSPGLDPSLLDSITHKVIAQSVPTFGTNDLDRLNQFNSFINPSATPVDASALFLKGLTVTGTSS